MKNKKIIYIIITFIILIGFVSIIIIKNIKQELNDHTPPEASSIVDELKKKYPDKEYQKLKGGEILTENTSFSKYSFITNNSIYIFNSQKLDNGEFVYKKAYDIDKNIKVMNIEPNLGSSVHFLDYNDTLYWLMDSNIDNKPIDR